MFVFQINVLRTNNKGHLSATKMMRNKQITSLRTIGIFAPY